MIIISPAVESGDDIPAKRPGKKGEIQANSPLTPSIGTTFNLSPFGPGGPPQVRTGLNLISDNEEDEMTVEEAVTNDIDVNQTIVPSPSRGSTEIQSATLIQQDGLTVILSGIGLIDDKYAKAFRECGIKSDAELRYLRGMSKFDQEELLEKVGQLCGMTLFDRFKFRVALRDYD